MPGAPPADPSHAKGADPAFPDPPRGGDLRHHGAVVDGLRIRTVDVGPLTQSESSRTLVLIPGHTARIDGYEALVRRLADRHRVVAFEFPGTGCSDKPVRSYTLRFYEDTLLGLLDALGIGEAVLVGGSLGGNLVLRLGHRVPQRFPLLVAWAPASAWRARPRLAAWMRRLGGRTLFWPAVWIQSRFWYAHDFPGRRAAIAGAFAHYREIMGPGFLRMYWGIAADQVASSLFDIASTITQPVLLLWGDRDNGGGMREGVATLRAMLPRVELHVFPGARHSIEVEIPADLACAIDEFVSRPREASPGERPRPSRSP